MASLVRQGTQQVAQKLNRKRRRKGSPWHGIVDPEKSVVLTYWDITSAFLLLVVAIFTPYETAFLDCASQTSFRWLANQVINAFFLADMVLQFFIAVPVSTPFGKRMIYDRRTIAMSYVKSWFVLDFLSVMPFDLFAPCEGLGALRIVRLIRLLKMLKLLRSLRLFKRWQEEFGFSYRIIMLNAIFGMVLFSSHWIACILGIVGKVGGPGGQNLCEAEELGSSECVMTWMTSAHVWWPRETEITPWNAYIISLHASISILIHPHTYNVTGPEEGLAFVVLTLFGGFLWTQVISRSTALCTSLDRHNIAYHQTMDDVNNISKELGLSLSMKRRLRKFFVRTSKFSKQETWRHIESRMSPQLRRDTCCELNKMWVLKIGILPKCTPSFITDLSSVVRMQVFSEMEHMGEPYHLYVLTLGLASLTMTRNRAPRILGPGAVWGEDHLLLNCRDLLQDNTALALHFVQCMSLSKKDFEEIAQLYPEYHHHIRWSVVKLAFKRGLVRFARITQEQRELEKPSSKKKIMEEKMAAQISSWRHDNDEQNESAEPEDEVPEMLSWLRRRGTVNIALHPPTQPLQRQSSTDAPRTHLDRAGSNFVSRQSTDQERVSMKDVLHQVRQLASQHAEMVAEQAQIVSQQEIILSEQRRLTEAVRSLTSALCRNGSCGPLGGESSKQPALMCAGVMSGPMCSQPTPLPPDRLRHDVEQVPEPPAPDGGKAGRKSQRARRSSERRAGFEAQADEADASSKASADHSSGDRCDYGG